MRVTLKSDRKILQNDLFNKLFSKIYQSDAKDIKAMFYDDLKKRVMKSRELFNVDFNKLSDYDFIQLINRYYDISVDDSEYIDIYSETNGKKYAYYEDFRTDTFGETPIITSNEGIHSSWVLTPVRIAYKALLSESVSFDHNREYTIAEINEMIKNKDLVLINIVYHVDDNLDKNKCTFIDTCKYKTYPFESCQTLYNEYFQAFIKRLRLVATNKKKWEDIRDYFLIYKQIVDSFLSEMPYIKVQSKIAKSTLDMVTSSDEYHEIENFINPKTI